MGWVVVLCLVPGVPDLVQWMIHIASKLSKYAVRLFRNLVQIHTTYVCMISKYFESVC